MILESLEEIHMKHILDVQIVNTHILEVNIKEKIIKRFHQSIDRMEKHQPTKMRGEDYV